MWVLFTGHDQLLEIRLLKKTGQHNFSFAQHHSSNNYFFCQGSLGHEQVRQIKLLTISIGKKLTFSVYMLH